MPVSIKDGDVVEAKGSVVLPVPHFTDAKLPRPHCGIKKHRFRLGLCPPSRQNDFVRPPVVYYIVPNLLRKVFFQVEQRRLFGFAVGFFGGCFSHVPILQKMVTIRQQRKLYSVD